MTIVAENLGNDPNIMPGSWNEIKSHSLCFFPKNGNRKASEDAEAKSSWDGFRNVFGITHKRNCSALKTSQES